MQSIWETVIPDTFEKVKQLVGAGANINERNRENKTVLHYTLEHGSQNVLETVKFLVEHGADVNCTDKFNTTALHLAVRVSSLEIVKFLVEHGANVNCKYENNVTALHLAASRDSLEIVKYLVEHDADLHCSTMWKETALHYAVIKGSLDIVQYLVEHGADVHGENMLGETADLVAARYGSQDIVNYLVETSDITIKLYIACEEGNCLNFENILRKSAVKDMDKYSGIGHSLFSIACSKGHTAIVRMLLAFGVDVRKEKRLMCGNDEIFNILEMELKKSLKHVDKIHNLKAMQAEELAKAESPLKCFATKKNLCIGNGAAATSVYVGIMEDGSEVAVKRMFIHACEDTAANEKNILSLFSAKKLEFIVNYRHFFKDNLCMYLVMDLCEETLKEHVLSQSTSIEYLLNYGPGMIKEILTGLNFLHEQRILHRDLKPSNVLVGVDGHMKLADFGISRVMDEDETTVETDVKGTTGWISAEVIEAIHTNTKCDYNRKFDVQVAGMIAHFILTKGDHPFGSLIERMGNIRKGNAVNLHNLENSDAVEFVSLLISHMLDDRPYAHQALTHPYVYYADISRHCTRLIRKLDCN